jgi:hypothetical protein
MVCVSLGAAAMSGFPLLRTPHQRVASLLGYTGLTLPAGGIPTVPVDDREFWTWN